MPTPNSSATARIYVSVCLTSLARAHRAARAFSLDHPTASVEVELAPQRDTTLAESDLDSPPDLFILVDGGIAVRLPLGSTESTIARALDRAWSEATAATIGGDR